MSSIKNFNPRLNINNLADFRNALELESFWQNIYNQLIMNFVIRVIMSQNGIFQTHMTIYGNSKSGEVFVCRVTISGEFNVNKRKLEDTSIIFDVSKESYTVFETKFIYDDMVIPKEETMSVLEEGLKQQWAEIQKMWSASLTAVYKFALMSEANTLFYNKIYPAYQKNPNGFQFSIADADKACIETLLQIQWITDAGRMGTYTLTPSAMTGELPSIYDLSSRINMSDF